MNDISCINYDDPIKGFYHSEAHSTQLQGFGGLSEKIPRMLGITLFSEQEPTSFKLYHLIFNTK